jgi:hypothetical protein
MSAHSLRKLRFACRRSHSCGSRRAELRIIVPETVSVTASVRAKVGEVYVLSRHDEGRNAEVSTGSGGLLVIDAKVGAGRIDIVRAVR